MEHHKNSSEESATQLEAEARRVTLLEEQLAKEKSAYIDLKKEAGTTLKFLQKERKLNKGLKEANAALESDAQQAAERLSETQLSQAQAQQSNREQMLEVKVEDLQGQLDETQTLLDVWRDKHDKAVEERAEAVEQLLHGSGAEGPSTMTQLLSSQREVKALQREVKALQAGRAASGQGAAQPNGNGGRWERQGWGIRMIWGLRHHDFGHFSPIFRRLWRVLSVLAPGSRTARKNGERTVEKGPKTG